MENNASEGMNNRISNNGFSSAFDYWPSKEYYDPGLSKDNWKDFILNIELPDHPRPMKMLKALMVLGGEATCKQLSAVFGGNPSRYVGCTVNLGNRAKNYFNLPACIDGEEERVFPIPFVGRHVIEDGAKHYSYKIRDELYEALKEIDLSNISPYADNEEEDGSYTAESAENVAKVLTDRQLESIAREHSSNQPRRELITAPQIHRDPYISEYAKRRANGICQLCGEKAPFTNKLGQPYLESHHIVWLSEGGADSVDNTVALCPNCHRKMHILNTEKDIKALKLKMKTSE